MPMEGIRMHYISCGKNVSMIQMPLWPIILTYYLRDNRILILEQKNQLKSMIHLNPYTLSVCGKKVNSLYVVALPLMPISDIAVP